MAKFHGPVGFAELVETSPGIHDEKITEHYYFGDVLRNNRRLQSANQLNDDVTVSIEISIVSDPFADHHFHEMRYVEFMGAKWKIINVDTRYPRLILTLGGVYNGEQA